MMIMGHAKNSQNNIKPESKNVNLAVTRSPVQLQIVDHDSDDGSDSDPESKKVVKPYQTNKAQALTGLQAQPCASPGHNFGQVDINNSQNVIIGNKTIYNGPVTIKQIIENKYHDNKAYLNNEHTEKNYNNINPIHHTAQEPAQSVQNDIVGQKKPALRLWHKLLMLIGCAILTGAILTVIIISVYPVYKDDSVDAGSPSHQFSTVYNATNDDGLTVVVGWYVIWCVNNSIIFAVGIIIILLPLLSLVTEEISKSKPIAVQNTVIQSSSTQEIRRGVPLIIAPNHLRIVSRSEWLAQPPENPLDVLKHPVPWVIIAHSAAEPCDSQSECIFRVRLIQNYHVESRGWFDIGYNFLVGGDGSAYYGRGWDYVGAHTKGYNSISMGIAFIGTFTKVAPPQQQIDACLKLIQLGVDEGKIAKDYKLLAHRQLMSTRSPGDKLYDIMKEWPHFVREDSNITDVLPKRD